MLRIRATILAMIATGLALVPLACGDGHTRVEGERARVPGSPTREPELPRAFLDTTFVPPVGNTILVNAGGDLQAALNRVTCGDTIKLRAGATFVGPFTLPNKPCTGWIVIRSSAPDDRLPPEGSRISPSYAHLLPKIISNEDTETPLRSLPGAHHYRLIGIEFTVGPLVTRSATLVLLDNEATSLDQFPHDIIFDRCYFHGESAKSVRRGLVLNSASTAAIDSYFAEFHTPDTDSQAIVGWSGPGPFKIVNNYLEAAAENIMFGGAGTSVAGLVPSDIEIRRNHFFKPLRWKKGHPSWDGSNWSIKNLFELKNAQRVLMEGNVFENSWLAGQTGFAIVLTPRYESGGAAGAVVADITFTNNIVRHAAGGIGMSGIDDTDPSGLIRLKRVKIANNLFEDINGARWGGDGRWLQPVHGSESLVVDHNTAFPSGAIGFEDGSKLHTGFVFQNNIVPHANYGFACSGLGEGLVCLNGMFPGGVFRKNLISGVIEGDYPPQNFYPSSIDKARFVYRSDGNYRLSSSSPYRKAGTDGKDIGADINAIEAATAGVVQTSTPSR